MFALNARIFLQNGAHAEFTRIAEREVAPLVRNQAGFEGAITLIVEGRDEAVHMTLWNSGEHADAYARDLYPHVLSTLWRVLDGNPRVQKYEVATSTLHNVPSRRIAATV